MPTHVHDNAIAAPAHPPHLYSDIVLIPPRRVELQADFVQIPTRYPYVSVKGTYNLPTSVREQRRLSILTITAIL